MSTLSLIGVIGTCDRVGGAERVFTNLMRGFATILGARVSIVTHLPPSTPFELPVAGVLRPDSAPAGPTMITRLRRILECSEPGTVLFPFQIRSCIVAAAANASLGRSRRLVTIANDRHNIQAMVAPSGDGLEPRLRARSFATAARWAYRRADWIVCNSRANAAYMRRFIGRTSPSVCTIYNPLDPGLSSRKHLSRNRSVLLEPRKPLITAHGRLAWRQKGWDVLLEAVRIVTAEFPAVRLRLIGDGPDRPFVEELIRSLDLGGQVELLGFRRDPWDLVEEGDVYVLPSRSEGLPNSLLEAMALGLPVVASDCPTGPGELLEGGRHGDLVAVGRPRDMAEAIIRLLRDGERRARLAQRARERAEEFTRDVAVRKYAVLFEEARLLAGERMSRRARR